MLPGRRFISFLLGAALICSGCQSKPVEPGSPTGAASSSSKADAGEMPVVTQTPDEIRTTMRGMDPFSKDFEEEQFKLVIKLDELRKQHGVEGFEPIEILHPSRAVAIVDPKTRKLAWQAMVCLNPDCPARGPGGGPLLFVSPVAGVSIGPNGEVVDQSGQPDISKSPNCPVCRRWEYCRIYELPESMARSRELMQELIKTREAAMAQRRAGRPHAENSSKAIEIQKEMGSLPKLYLVPQDDKLHEVGLFLTPLKTK